MPKISYPIYGMTNHANLKGIYSQHWEHMRYVAKERLTFTSFYLTFMGVGVTILFKTNELNIKMKYVIVIFLLILSAVGFLIMIRILITFWYHYYEIKRLTPLMCDSETFDYEDKIKKQKIEAEVKKDESLFWCVNKIFLWMSKKKGIVPLTLLFPLIYFVGGIVSLALLISL